MMMTDSIEVYRKLWYTMQHFHLKQILNLKQYSIMYVWFPCCKYLKVITFNIVAQWRNMISNGRSVAIFRVQQIYSANQSKGEQWRLLF